jgi:hypothetical protein
MKKLLLFYFLFTCFISVAQVKELSLKADSNRNEILYFFDNIQISNEVLSYIDVNKIADVRVTKPTVGPRENYAGRIDITSKSPKDFNFLSFAGIKSKYVNATTKPILLLVNGNFINNAANFKIDDNFISTVEVEQGADFNQLKNIYPTFAIVNIITKNVAQLKAKPVSN